MVQEIKIYRAKLDALIQLADELPSTSEINTVVTRLNESKMELGRVLQELGSTSPYRHSKNPSNELLIDLSEPDGMPAYDSVSVSMVRKIKAFRHRIDSMEHDLKNLHYNNVHNNIWVEEHFKDAIKYLIQAGMWLGMELARIKKEQDVYREI